MSDDTIIRLTTWEELEALPGYVASIHKGGLTLGRIRGKYAMKGQTMRPCAISECRTAHLQGAIISLSDGTKTHIGHRCGKKYFPDEWDAQLSDFTGREQDAQRRLQLSEIRAAASAMRDTIAILRTRIDRYKMLKRELDDKVPRVVLDDIYRRAERGNSTIMRTRVQTRDERDLASVSGLRANRSGAVEEEVAKFAGLSVLNSIYDPWRIVAYDLEPACSAVLAIEDAKSAAFRNVAKRWSNNAPKLARVERGLVLAEEFFSNANLRLLTMLESARASGLARVQLISGDGLTVEIKRRR